MPAQDFPCQSHNKSSLFGHVINLLLTKLVLSRWLDISLVLLCIFIDQPSLPHAWSITHISWPASLLDYSSDFNFLVHGSVIFNRYCSER